MIKVFEELKDGLIVSCQAEDNDPFNTPEGVSLFAKAAEMGGAKGIRSEGIEKTKKIIETVNLPVIGIIKSKFEDGYVKITGSFKDIESLVKINCNIIAIDGTFRKREGLNGPEFIKEIRKNFDVIIIADVSTFEEGIACADYGADAISTTLSGYTPYTKHLNTHKPDFELLKNLVKNLSIPVIAEGRYNKPEFAAQAIRLGAWSVVVGTAITRPRIITKWFVDSIELAKFDLDNNSNNFNNLT